MADSENTEDTTTSTTTTNVPEDARDPKEQAVEGAEQAHNTVVEEPANADTLSDVAQTAEERFAQARVDAISNHNGAAIVDGTVTEESTEEEVVA